MIVENPPTRYASQIRRERPERYQQISNYRGGALTLSCRERDRRKKVTRVIIQCCANH